jgi:hypothetical protein
MPERPERMYRRGRPIVPVDNLSEPLYRRFSSEEVIKGEFPGVCFQFPDCSVNRGGVAGGLYFGEPEDVIFGFPTWGILKILVGDIPSHVLTGDNREIPIRVRHVPWEKIGEENYAHCEIQIFRLDEKGDLIHSDKDLSKGAKKIWRQLMSRKVKERPDGIYKLPD